MSQRALHAKLWFSLEQPSPLVIFPLSLSYSLEETDICVLKHATLLKTIQTIQSVGSLYCHIQYACEPVGDD